jgi:hypothetical protein
MMGFLYLPFCPDSRSADKFSQNFLSEYPKCSQLRLPFVLFLSAFGNTFLQKRLATHLGLFG